MPNAVKYKTGNLTGSLQKGNVALGVSGSFGPTSTTGWYNGPNPPTSGLYQIIETAASGDPEVFCPQNDAELIKFARWKGATGADTGSVAAILAWIGTQTNLMAVNFQYESIVTDGLVLNVDAGFVGSYPTINTTWYDISGNNNNGTLTNGPTFNSANSGSIVFDGVDDYISIPDINFTTATIDIWVYVNSYGSGGTVFTYQSSGGFEIWSDLNGFIRYNKNPNVNLTSGNGFALNSWKNMVATSDGTVNTLYLNGVNIGSNNGGIFDNTSGDIRISGYGNYMMNGRCPILKMYNRALTASEVLQNYNAQKGRFGL